ncbi:MAG: hypothetical protein U0930_04390 [Pirellulales bacterium]
MIDSQTFGLSPNATVIEATAMQLESLNKGTIVATAVSGPLTTVFPLNTPLPAAVGIAGAVSVNQVQKRPEVTSTIVRRSLSLMAI